MNIHTDYQIIRDGSGKPAFVVVPYENWVKQSSLSGVLIPNEVVGAVIEDGKTLVRAWREYFGLTQVELQRHEGFDVFASVGPPGTDVVGDAGVATDITAGLDLRKQCACCTPVVFWGVSRRL